jgi:hypothetical protein
MIDYPPGFNTEPREPGKRETRLTHRADVWLRGSVVAVGLLLLMLFATSTVTVVLIRQQQVQNVSTLTSAQAAARAAQRTAESVRSCTTPGLKCYERAQTQTAQAVAGLTSGSQKAAAAAAACALNLSHPDFAAIYGCVIRTLAHPHKP